MNFNKKFFVVVLLLISSLSCGATDLFNSLKSLGSVVSIDTLQTDLFAERYLLRFRQPVDHADTTKGWFTQRVIVSHVDADAPVVLVTEGYGAAYALNPSYRDEISTHLESNQIVVEHRYFLESTPKPCKWEYMTGKNAANDLHNITTALKSIYKDKWIATGISKGGQNCIIYRTYYPNDVDISVPYVAPVCFGIEDGRHEPFIDNCGTPEQRAKILEFQQEALRRKEAMIPMLDSLIAKKGWVFQNITTAEAIDFSVLEYPFSLWQWGSNTDLIPPSDASDKEIFDHLMDLASPEYFSNPYLASFFVHATADLGYYGYYTKPFEGLLTIDTADDYLRRIFLPEEAQHITFSNQMHKDIYKFLGENDPKMIFIYGQYDPWSAAAVQDKLFVDKKNMAKYVEPWGSHRARIATMSQGVQTRIWNSIKNWLAE